MTKLIRITVITAWILTSAGYNVSAGSDALPTKIYWGDSTGRILRSDVTGGAIEEVLATSTIPQAMTIDPLNRKIYWSDANDASIHRANLDGTGAEVVIASPGPDHQRAGLAIDPFDSLLYYTQTYDGQFGRTSTMNFVFLPETNPQFIGGNFYCTARDVALHLPSNSVYWLRQLNTSSLCTLRRADIQPYPYDHDIDQIPVSNALTLTIDATKDEIITGTSTAISRYAHLGGAVLGSISPGNTPTSMTNDPFDGDGRIYWSSSTSGEIKRSNHAGTVIEIVHSGLAQPGPIVVIRSVDCNSNGIEDICEISCGSANGPCDVPGCGSGVDCDRDNMLDICEPFLDCNGNSVDDRCDVRSGSSTDCNLNLVPDECDANDCNGNDLPDSCDLEAETSEDCNDNQVPDECDVASGTETDCNGNLIPDSCEPDCNANDAPDDCDVATGFSEDCNTNGDPDECEPDCNANDAPDDCDVATGFSEDCNGNGKPDECDLSGNDCNSNGIPDACDLSSGTSTNCDANGVPDECELAGHDCNGNAIHDACDISSGFSQDANQDGWPDECLIIPPDEPQADPSGFQKPRFVSFSVPSGSGDFTALRITLVSLHHVVPPYSTGPSTPFTAFEGKSVWVGPPSTYVEGTSQPGNTFKAAKTQCGPHYRDWTTLGLVHVTGSHIVPSSIYEVQQVPIGCQGEESDCPAVSAPLEIRTSRWADVVTPFNPPDATAQPNIGDVQGMVNKFRALLGAPIKARVVIAGQDAFGVINVPTLTNDFNLSHIAAGVDAFRGNGYPYKMGKCTGNPLANSSCVANGNPAACCTGPGTGSCSAFTGACSTNSDCTGANANGTGPCILESVGTCTGAPNGACRWTSQCGGANGAGPCVVSTCAP